MKSGKNVLGKKIKNWLDHRKKDSSTKIKLPAIDIEYHKNLAGSNNSFIACEW
jgi:hypothetical protein